MSDSGIKQRDEKNQDENKVIHIGILEHTSMGLIDSITEEFWKRRPANNLRSFKNEKKPYFSMTYLFKTLEDAEEFEHLLKQNKINYITAPESKYDKLATEGMTFSEMRNYLSTKIF